MVLSLPKKIESFSDPKIECLYFPRKEIKITFYSEELIKKYRGEEESQELAKEIVEYIKEKNYKDFLPYLDEETIAREIRIHCFVWHILPFFFIRKIANPIDIEIPQSIWWKIPI